MIFQSTLLFTTLWWLSGARRPDTTRSAPFRPSLTFTGPTLFKPGAGLAMAPLKISRQKNGEVTYQLLIIQVSGLHSSSIGNVTFSLLLASFCWIKWAVDENWRKTFHSILRLRKSYSKYSSTLLKTLSSFFHLILNQWFPKSVPRTTTGQRD